MVALLQAASRRYLKSVGQFVGDLSQGFLSANVISKNDLCNIASGAIDGFPQRHDAGQHRTPHHGAPDFKATAGHIEGG
jgi:hypothetical protein